MKDLTANQILGIIVIAIYMAAGLGAAIGYVSDNYHDWYTKYSIDFID